ncbi:RNA polymerase Rpb7 N-terminal domain-containing protein isoform X1 [Tasmannia lanceolata]|uniref:RNA polymerase Rpb7 N-terminal domain-containing protein isoform X1 n=1 Tax=Tasmannia lanceolata TaxID=3420 RepID=UPI004062EDF9
MFALSLIEHDLSLPPELLSLPLDKAISGELERLFLDKVIPNLGLCVSVYDIQSVNGGIVYPNEGAPAYVVRFRLVMFRPFVGEILVGKIQSSDVNGLRLSLGFFNDIYVPVHLLKLPRSEKNGVWIWEYEGEELYLDKDEEILFRVHSVKYPPIPVVQDKDANPFAPMEITAGIIDDGLGLLSWWGE